MSYPNQPPQQPPPYGQQPHGVPYAQQSTYPSQVAPQPPPARQPRWPLAVLAAAIVFALSGGWFLYDRVIKTDSGVAACKAMAGDKQIVDGAKVGADEQLTESQYRQLRKVFEDSRYDDIREHGTKLIDIVWQVTQLGKDPGMAVLGYVSTLTEQMSGLQSACADQGIIIKLPAK